MTDEHRRRRKLSAIMMADVSGFSAMMGADEERTITLIQDFHERVNQLVDVYEGRVVDTAGDSVFGEFDSVVNAVRCARQIQEEQSAINKERPESERVATRIGVHLGDVVVEDYHVYGDGVNIAARLEPLADPGGICISEAVYHQIRNKLDLPLEDIGIRELKNIQHPLRLYRVPPPALINGEVASASEPEPAPPSGGSAPVSAPQSEPASHTPPKPAEPPKSPTPPAAAATATTQDPAHYDIRESARTIGQEAAKLLRKEAEQAARALKEQAKIAKEQAKEEVRRAKEEAKRGTEEAFREAQRAREEEQRARQQERDERQRERQAEREERQRERQARRHRGRKTPPPSHSDLGDRIADDVERTVEESLHAVGKTVEQSLNQAAQAAEEALRNALGGSQTAKSSPEPQPVNTLDAVEPDAIYGPGENPVERTHWPQYRSWQDDLMRTGNLIMLITAVVLLLSPAILFPTGGVFPTGGAILLAVSVGRVWGKRANRPGNFLVALGAAIASGALWTDWSTVTNTMFILGGLIVAAVGYSANHRGMDYTEYEHEHDERRRHKWEKRRNRRRNRNRNRRRHHNSPEED